jgi:hypothetical protein
MFEFVDTGSLSWATSQNRLFSGDYVNIFLEKQRNDTVLTHAGVPILPGDLYYGVHTPDLEPSDFSVSTVRAVMDELVPAIRGLHRHAEQHAEFRPPELVVGVTYWGLVRLAGRVGFHYAEVPEGIFETRQNARVGWKGFLAAILDSYTHDTEKGRKGEEVRLGVLYQSVDALLTWSP